MITFVTSASAPWGAEHSLALIVRGLHGQGLRTRVLTCSEPVAAFLGDRTQAEIRNVEIRSRSRLSRWRGFGRAVAAGRDRTDVIVLFSPNLYQLSVPLATVGGRVVLDLHDDFRSTRARAKLRLWVRASDGAIAISDYVRSQLPGSARCVVVPRPMAEMDHTIDAGEADPRSVGIIGRIVPEKRIDLAIRGISIVNDLHLHVYGSVFEGSEGHLSELEALARRVAPGRVHFHGRCEPQDIYGKVGVVLVANPREASGRTVGEAMLAGRVALVPSRGGAREFVEPGRTGFVWEVSDGPIGIAKALGQILRTSDLEVVGRSAQQEVRRQRSVATVADQYLDALTELTRPTLRAPADASRPARRRTSVRRVTDGRGGRAGLEQAADRRGAS